MGTREDILTESNLQLREAGLDGLSMRGIAERLDVTATTLYRYFDGKAELLAELVDDAWRELEGYLERALGSSDPITQLNKTVEAYLEFALEHPHLYELLYLMRPARLDSTPALSKKRREAWRQMIDLLARRCAECMRAGALSESDPTEVARTLWSQCHGLVASRLTGLYEAPEAKEEFVDAYWQSLRRMLEGLAV